MRKGQISNLAQIAYLRRYTLCGGAGDGLKIMEIDNGRLRFLLNESKALDMPQLWHDGQNVGFLSKNGLTAREADFSERFEGGMLYTCGLDSVGAREGFALHGTLHSHPAEVVRAECGEEGICVEAVVSDTALFGKNLRLKRRIFTEIGSESVTVEDTLVNEGCRTEKYCLLYHVNAGYPMLDEGARLEAETERVTPRNETAKGRLSERTVFSAPVAGQEEACYFLKQKTPRVRLINERIGKAFTLEYSGETLPCFVQWNSAASGDYALGLEPCTTELDGGFRYSALSAGEKVSFRLRLGVQTL